MRRHHRLLPFLAILFASLSPLCAQYFCNCYDNPSLVIHFFYPSVYAPPPVPLPPPPPIGAPLAPPIVPPPPVPVAPPPPPIPISAIPPPPPPPIGLPPPPPPAAEVLLPPPPAGGPLPPPPLPPPIGVPPPPPVPPPPLLPPPPVVPPPPVAVYPAYPPYLYSPVMMPGCTCTIIGRRRKRRKEARKEPQQNPYFEEFRDEYGGFSVRHEFGTEIRKSTGEGPPAGLAAAKVKQYSAEWKDEYGAGRERLPTTFGLKEQERVEARGGDKEKPAKEETAKKPVDEGIYLLDKFTPWTLERRIEVMMR